MASDRVTPHRPMPRWRKDLGLVLPSVALLLLAIPLFGATLALRRQHETMVAAASPVAERYRDWGLAVRANAPEPARNRLVAALQLEASLRADAEEQYARQLFVIQTLAVFVALFAGLQVVRVHRPFRRLRARRRARRLGRS